jgi:hypothetical protein
LERFGCISASLDASAQGKKGKEKFSAEICEGICVYQREIIFENKWKLLFDFAQCKTLGQFFLF